MIRSMTGFGLGEADEHGVAVRVEARAVNHRYLQLKTRLPSDFAELEPELDVLVKAHLSRGAVTLTLHVTRSAAAASYAIDADAAVRYHEQLRRLAEERGLLEDLRLGDLLSLPGVVTQASDPARHEREHRLAMRAATQALEHLVAARGEEGARTAEDLVRHLAELERVRARIEERMPRSVRAHHEALQKRVAELLGPGRAVSEADLAREVAILADRMDVSEELARLASHLTATRELLRKGGEVGRRLDFLVQELLREANTIGSKCNDAEIARDVVELKTTIERIREQVQNLE